VLLLDEQFGRIEVFRFGEERCRGVAFGRMGVGSVYACAFVCLCVL
jgi:hypothetical protein